MTVDGNTVHRGPVSATLTFFTPPADGSVPYNYVEEPPEGKPRNNLTPNPQEVTIHDIRGREREYTLDNAAFQVIDHVPSAMDTADPAFTDDALVKKTFYPEIEQLLLTRIPGAEKVVIFDHTIRRSSPDAPRAPVTRTHIDQSPSAAAERVRLHAGDEAEVKRRLAGRYRIVNVWRPLNGPVRTNPLAFADSRSVADTDLVPVEHRYPHRTGETMGVVFNPAQRWHYLSGMENTERLLLKCCDSADVPGRRVPHTAFLDSRASPDAPGRESIEVRALVFG